MSGRDKQGRPLQMIGTHADITKRKKAEEELRQKTEQVEQFFSVALDMLCIANTDGFFTLLNPAWEETLGWTRSELMAKKFLEFVHPDDIQNTLNAISDLGKQRKVINFINRYRCKDGTYRWIEWRSAPVQRTIYAAAHDITDLIINEERLIHKKNILDAISYAATILMSSLSDEAINQVIARIGNAVNVSRAYIFTHSYSSEGKSLISQRYEWTKEGIIPQMGNPTLQNLAWQDMGYKRWAQVLMNGGVLSGTISDFPEEEKLILTEQDIRSLVVVPISSRKEFLGFIGFDDCVTEHEWSEVEIETLSAAAGLIGASFGRKEAEDEVRLRENNLSTFFDTINDFLFVLDMQGQIIKVNETVIQRLGYSNEELIGKSVLMVHPVNRRGEALEIVADMIAKRCKFCPIPLQTKEGTRIPVETRVVVGVWNGQPALFGVSKDISDITLSEEKFSKAFHTSGSLMTISRNGEFVDVNKTFLDTLGYTRDEVVGKSPSDLKIFVNASDQERLRQDIRDKKSSRNNKVLIRAKNGRIVTGILSADLIQIQETTMLLTVMNDVTEITRLSDALLQANAKLNLLSSITRHDILNQVQALMFVEEFIGRKIPEDSSAQEELKMLSKTISTIHSQILFTRDYQDMGIAAPSWMRVEDVAQKEGKNRSFADIKIEILTGDLEIYADPMFSKVCYNLMENAQRHGGHVTHITVSFIETPNMGVLVFEDNGSGVVKTEKELIFKRGFGKNTGLGLFLTAEILSITGISIRETGEEGKGARFEISIPLNGFRYKTETNIYPS